MTKYLTKVPKLIKKLSFVKISVKIVFMNAFLKKKSLYIYVTFQNLQVFIYRKEK